MQRISDQGSERATSDSGKIVTAAGRTHVAWQDITRSGYLNRVRTLDHDTGTWSEPVTVDVGVDNHARGVLSLDHDGFLHMVLGGHGTPVRWCRSREPHDASAWTEPEPVGIGTYPIFRCAADGTLLLTVRGRGEKRHDRGVDLYARPPGGPWQHRTRLVQLAREYGDAYAAFHMQLDEAADGTLHAIVDFYEGADETGRGIHQAVCCIRSRDQGRTWHTAHGTPAPPHARPEDLDILARDTRTRHEAEPPPELRGGGLVVDAAGHPHAFYLDHRHGAGAVVHAADTGDGWRQAPLQHHWESAWPGLRATEATSTVRDDGSLCLLITLTPWDETGNQDWHEGRAPLRAMKMRERDDERVIWLLSDDGGGSWRLQTFLEPGSVCNVPSLERRVGANPVPAQRLPGVVYFDGSRDYPGGGTYFGRVDEILAAGDFHPNHVWLALDDAGASTPDQGESP